MKRVREKAGLAVDNVEQAIRRMHAEGVRKVLVQPSHIINGIENDMMREDVLQYRDLFTELAFGNPLLSKDEDYLHLTKVVGGEIFADIQTLTGVDLGQDKKSALVLMGHGTDHYINAAYAALDYRFKAVGHENVYVGAVEGYPFVDTVLEQMQRKDFSRVVLLPLMIVAGEHAKEDMAGEEPDSWKSLFTEAGYKVDCILKGLGEYAGIRRMLLAHAAEASA